MKSDFKCNNWILSVMHMHVLISEQNTHPPRHTYWHEWTENTTQYTLHHRIMCSPSEDVTIYRYLSDIPSFEIFLPVAEGFIFVCLPPRHDRSERTEEWKVHFARKCLFRKWRFKRGKMNQPLWLAASSNCKSWLAVAKWQENAQTLSLPPDTRTRRHKNDHFIIVLH